MAFLEWTSSYSVGLPEFDKHHHHLFDLLNKANDACLQTRQTGTFFAIVTELAEYANYHFAAEEKLMGSCFYPELSDHCNEHALYVRKISELLEMTTPNSNECTIELVELTRFLMDWLTHHILEVDMRYSRLLTSGIRT